MKNLRGWLNGWVFVYNPSGCELQSAINLVSQQVL